MNSDWVFSVPDLLLPVSSLCSNLAEEVSLSTSPLDSRGFEVARGSERLFVILPRRGQRCPFKQAHHFSRQDYIQSHDHCSDLKAHSPYDGYDNKIKQTHPDVREGFTVDDWRRLLETPVCMFKVQKQAL